MSDLAAAPDARSTPRFNMLPLVFETFACTLAMMSFVALIGPISRVLDLAPWQAGVTVTVGGIAWVLLARVWGAASDRHGRRVILLRGLGGFVLSYLALCLFVVLALRWLPSAWLAFAGVVMLRGIVGGFYAAVPTTGAALVADHVEPQQRARVLAGLGASSAVGMVVGPGLAGLLAVHGLELPLIVTAVLPLVALLVMWRWLPRDERPQVQDAPTLRLRDARLRRPLVLGFAAMFSVTIAQVAVGFFALDQLRLEATEVARAAGIALTSVGVALILAQLLLRQLNWPPQRLIRVGGLISALGFAAVIFATSAPLLWAAYFVAAAGMGWVFPSVSALAANAVEAHEQGATAGTLAASHGVGMIVGPLAGTLVYELYPGAPFVLIAALLVLCVLWPERAPAVQEHAL